MAETWVGRGESGAAPKNALLWVSLGAAAELRAGHHCPSSQVRPPWKSHPSCFSPLGKHQEVSSPGQHTPGSEHSSSPSSAREQLLRVVVAVGAAVLSGAPARRRRRNVGHLRRT